MKLEAVPGYQLIMQQEIPDIHSQGYLLKHKKAGPESWCWKMMITTKSLILPSGLLRRTAQEWLIFWNTAYYAAQNISL